MRFFSGGKLIVIQDGQTPLSGTVPVHTMNPLTGVMWLLGIIVICAVIIYLYQCLRYKKMILRLKENQNQQKQVYVGFRLDRLKETKSELEQDVLESMGVKEEE